MLRQSAQASQADLLSVNAGSWDAKSRFNTGVAWRYGLVLGIALTLVAWGPDAWQLDSAFAELFWGKLLLGGLTVVPLSVLAALLAARVQHSLLLKWLIWSAWGLLTGILALLIPFQGLTFLAGLLDSSVRGQAVFPFTPEAEFLAGMCAFLGAVAGLPALLLNVFAVERAWDRSSARNRMTLAGWLMLLSAAPLALALGGLYDMLANSPLRAPFQLTAQVVQVGLSSPLNADLATRSSRDLVIEMTAAQWHDHFSPTFTQRLAGFDPNAFQDATLDISFDNGFLWRCQVVQFGRYVGSCVDLTAVYRDWTNRFLRTGQVQCDGCPVTVAQQAADWWSQHRREFGAAPEISVEHHAGGVVVVHVRAGDTRGECRFIGAQPALLQQCENVP